MAPMALAAPTGTGQKPAAGPEAVQHRELLDGEFWRRIPAYADVGRQEFYDHQWQAKHSITSVGKLLSAVQALVPPAFIADAEEGFRRAPMSVRVSPYLLSLIDWSDPVADPLRTQFIPLASSRLPDHPKVDLDSLHERKDAPVLGLTHRYPDRALFLPLDMCPVYCRFCTRSYAVGRDTEEVTKFQLRANPERWGQAFAYIASRPEVEDVVISGGDSYQLRPDQLEHIGNSLLAIPHVRRMRFATKGPAVMPQKILTDEDWTDALTRVVERGRRQHKDVVLHTHFNHPNEITELTRAAMNRLFERGIYVRNQTVLQRRVNDTPQIMTLLVKRLSYVNVHPYYAYQHDMVRGVEDLRTPLWVTLDLEKRVRGATTGFNTPIFVVDAPGGGGKRDAHSFEHYDRTTGISVFTSPAVKPDETFYYFDPLDTLPEEGQRRWADPLQHQAMIEEAAAAASR
ncbi:MAG: KamA family radical SAM protein [Myxococcales bacterium]|nr:KamA family radical SAM protein [Myxococcales bacterium]